MYRYYIRNRTTGNAHKHTYTYTDTNSYISSSFNLEIPQRWQTSQTLPCHGQVVVNDLGGSATGSGSSTSAAVP